MWKICGNSLLTVLQASRRTPSLPSEAAEVSIFFLEASRCSSAPVGHLRSSSRGRLRLCSKGLGFSLTSLDSPVVLSQSEKTFHVPMIRSGLTGKCFYLVTGQLSHSTMSSQEPELMAIIVSGRFCKSSTTTWRKNFKRVWTVAL